MARGGGGTAVYLQLGHRGGRARGARAGTVGARCPSHADRRAPWPRPGRMRAARERPCGRRDAGDPRGPRRRGARALAAPALRAGSGRGRGAASRGQLLVLRPLAEGRVCARRRVGDREQPRRAARGPTALGRFRQRLLGQGPGGQHQPQVLSAAVRAVLQVSPVRPGVRTPVPGEGVSLRGHF